MTSRRNQYSLFVTGRQNSGYNPCLLRDFTADREIYAGYCPEQFRPFVVLLKRTKTIQQERQT
jgi:hypothetical protein